MGDARHTRPKGRGGPRRAGLRQLSVTMLVMLVIQYGLGIILNLYVAVPASDAHAGILTEIATAPLVLTVHAILGIALIGTGLLVHPGVSGGPGGERNGSRSRRGPGPGRRGGGPRSTPRGACGSGPRR